MKPISITEVEYIAHTLAKEWMTWNEPIPEFKTRNPNILESCLIAPFQKFDKKYLYQGLIEKSSVLFYFLIKNHPFQNGNKRIAVTTLLYFLYKNEKWLRVSNQELYNFAKWVAESNAHVKDATVDAVQKFVGLYMEDFKESEK
ncbi:MAG: death on curing protein [Parcubacteria group bacterium Gr01-1014_17]|nr:MAG: death on curing protein [Parcubacteria group bacterium Gr01-1014_17]